MLANLFRGLNATSSPMSRVIIKMWNNYLELVRITTNILELKKYKYMISSQQFSFSA